MSAPLVSVSLLACDFSKIGEECNKVLQAGADWLHLDVMDGAFVNNISFGPCICKAARDCTPKGSYLDAHLMINEPLHYLPAFLAAGVDSVTIHVELKDTIDLSLCLDSIRKGGCKAGLAINPATPVEQLLPYLDEVDMILVMSVVPGFGGQRFMPEVLEKVSFLHQMRQERKLNYILQMDGGIDNKTAPLCKQAGADCLVSGSYLFQSADIKAAVASLH